MSSSYTRIKNFFRCNNPEHAVNEEELNVLVKKILKKDIDGSAEEIKKENSRLQIENEVLRLRTLNLQADNIQLRESLNKMLGLYASQTAGLWGFAAGVVHPIEENIQKND